MIVWQIAWMLAMLCRRTKSDAPLEIWGEGALKFYNLFRRGNG